MASNWSVENALDEPPGRLRIEPYLDNIRSAYNVGSIFRTADGVGVETLHLGGISPTPEHPKVVKTALGAQRSVRWEYHPNGVEAVKLLKGDGYRIWSVENTPTAERLFSIDLTRIGEPLLLVLGNEKAGIDPGILDLSDKIISVPMLGRKNSLNVVVAFGVVSYYLRFGHQKAVD